MWVSSSKQCGFTSNHLRATRESPKPPDSGECRRLGFSFFSFGLFVFMFVFLLAAGNVQFDGSGSGSVPVPSLLLVYLQLPAAGLFTT